MEQLPFVLVEGGTGRMEGHRLPAALPQAAMAEHLEILRRGFRRRSRIAETPGEAHALDRHLRDAGDGRWRLDAHDIEECRHEVAGMAELRAQLATAGDALGP